MAPLAGAPTFLLTSTLVAVYLLLFSTSIKQADETNNPNLSEAAISGPGLQSYFSQEKWMNTTDLYFQSQKLCLKDNP